MVATTKLEVGEEKEGLIWVSTEIVLNGGGGREGETKGNNPPPVLMN